MKDARHGPNPNRRYPTCGKISAIILAVFLLFGCASTLKFNAKNAQKVKQNTIVIMDTVQDYLISWPLYSGWIRRATEPYKNYFPPEFFKAMDSLDDLARYCPGLTDPPPLPGGKCDFSDWQPEVIVSALAARIRVFQAEHPAGGYIIAELGPRIMYEGKKRTEYATGYAAGDATIMASSVVFTILKQVSKYVPDLGDLLKLIPVLVL